MKQLPDPSPQSRNKPRLSPIEQLHADKRRIEAQCREQEKKLGEDFAGMWKHAPSLLLSGISSMLFPADNFGRKAGDDSRNAAFTASDYLAVTKSLLPVAWNIIRPMLVTWAIHKAKSLVCEWFYDKKRGARRN
jgi:hypothetical protein